LAEEEQFYLVSPVALLLLTRTRRPFRWLLWLLGALLAYRFTLIADHATLTRLYRAPDPHSEGLVLGAVLAFLVRSGFRAREWVAKLGLVLVVPPIFFGNWTV